MIRRFLLQTVGTKATVDHLGFVDPVALCVLRFEAGRSADGAINIGNRAAVMADHVVVVVAGLRLVASYRAGRLDLAQQSRLGEHTQTVVDGLM